MSEQIMMNGEKEQRGASRHVKLLEKAIEIEAEETRSFGYLTSVLCQTTLPYVNPRLTPGERYTRNTGEFTLNITPLDKRYGVPFGSYPRLILAWICTEAKTKKSKVIDLGKSQHEFITKKLNLDGGGKNIDTVRNQALMLFNAVIWVRSNSPTHTTDKLMIAKSEQIFWHKDEDPNQTYLWDSTLVLTEDFFQEIMEKAVPLDLRILNALTKSPTSMDIYAWLPWRLFRLKVSGKPEARIPWTLLARQFGTSYAADQKGIWNFKGNFCRHLKSVLQFMPGAERAISITPDALILTSKK